MTARSGRAADLLDAARTSLWPLPLLSLLLAVGLGVALPALDARLADRLPGAVSALLFGGGPAAARSVLEAVAGSLVTVTSLTFSLTVVTLQLASSQYSPRLLRTFARDTFVQVTLALFLSTFAYALTVLRTVRSPDEGGSFVPQLSVTVAYVATMASAIVLVLFLAHLTRRIRVETMVADVREEALRTLRRQLPQRDGSETTDAAEMARPQGRPALVPASRTGFLTRVDAGALLAMADDAGAVLEMVRRVGDFVVAGTPLVLAWPVDGAGPLDAARFARPVRKATTIGAERTAVQDVGFGLRQLTDVAAKALSPGVNDPTTAIHAVDQAAAVLCEAARRDLSPPRLRDTQGRVRVLLRRPSLDELLDDVASPVRRYGAGDPDVLGALLRLLRDVAWSAPPGQRSTVTRHLAQVRAVAASADLDDGDRRPLAELAAEVDAALQGDWPGQL